jgi:hypothetical protein
MNLPVPPLASLLAAGVAVSAAAPRPLQPPDRHQATVRMWRR